MSEEQKLLGTNKHWIEAEVDRVKCTNYEPCPICNKCRVKASHLYLKCQECEVPFCAHDNKARQMMIKRSNFALDKPSPELAMALKNLERND